MESFDCIFCAEEVTFRQEALLCDGCDRWQHRRCQTGITREDYRAAVGSGKEIVWTCIYCVDDDSIPGPSDAERAWRATVSFFFFFLVLGVSITNYYD